MPAVLRPLIKLGDEHSQVVGIAYIHGVVNGEFWDEVEMRKESFILTGPLWLGDQCNILRRCLSSASIFHEIECLRCQ